MYYRCKICLYITNCKLKTFTYHGELVNFHFGELALGTTLIGLVHHTVSTCLSNIGYVIVCAYRLLYAQIGVLAPLLLTRYIPLDIKLKLCSHIGDARHSRPNSSSCSTKQNFGFEIISDRFPPLKIMGLLTSESPLSPQCHLVPRCRFLMYPWELELLSTNQTSWCLALDRLSTIRPVAVLPYISALCVVVGITWLLLLPLDSNSRRTYISENALLPGQASTYFGGSEQNIFRAYRHEVAALANATDAE